MGLDMFLQIHTFPAGSLLPLLGETGFKESAETEKVSALHLACHILKLNKDLTNFKVIQFIKQL